MSDLKEQIAQEKETLKNAPVITPVVGQAGRCSICGRVVPQGDLQPYDQHVQGGTRYACSLCHPQRKP